MKHVLVLMTLAACATPLEQCIRGVSGDLATLDRLIAETQGNVSRGFAYESRVEMRPDWVDCTAAPTKANPTPHPQMCFDDVPTDVRRPVAVDLNAERAKLASMQERRAQLAASMAPALEACRQRYPE